jgi:ribosome-binding protein aMBF1 (putative translation factor)
MTATEAVVDPLAARREMLLRPTDIRMLNALGADLDNCERYLAEHSEEADAEMYTAVLRQKRSFEYMRDGVLDKYRFAGRDSAVLLRWARERAGISKSALARAEGVNWKTIARYELGTAEPSRRRLARLLAHCGTTIDALCA